MHARPHRETPPYTPEGLPAGGKGCLYSGWPGPPLPLPLQGAKVQVHGSAWPEMLGSEAVSQGWARCHVSTPAGSHLQQVDCAPTKSWMNCVKKGLYLSAQCRNICEVHPLPFGMSPPRRQPEMPPGELSMMLIQPRAGKSLAKHAC